MRMVIERLLSEIEATSARYAGRSVQRAQTSEALDRHGILYADEHERVKRRLRRLNASWALARAIETKPGLPSEDDRQISPREPAVYGADVLGLERLMGANDLIDIAFLSAGHWPRGRSGGSQPGPPRVRSTAPGFLCRRICC